MKKEKMTNFETLAYFVGATGILFAFLLTTALSIPFTFLGILLITILFVAVDILYYLAIRKEKDVTEQI